MEKWRNAHNTKCRQALQMYILGSNIHSRLPLLLCYTRIYCHIVWTIHAAKFPFRCFFFGIFAMIWLPLPPSIIISCPFEHRCHVIMLTKCCAPEKYISTIRMLLFFSFGVYVCLLLPPHIHIARMTNDYQKKKKIVEIYTDTQHTHTQIHRHMHNNIYPANVS